MTLRNKMVGPVGLDAGVSYGSTNQDHIKNIHKCGFGCILGLSPNRDKTVPTKKVGRKVRDYQFL